MTRDLGVVIGLVVCLSFMTAVLPPSAAQAPPAGQLPPGISPGPNLVPKAGVCPLPILPAIPKYDDTAFFASADVPHGKVEVASFHNSAGVDETMHVYLPPGYEASPAARYPVLYLNHGGGGNDASWTDTGARGGSAQWILDNLIAAGKSKPMIIAMPNTSKCATGIPSAPGKDDACTEGYLKDIIPYLESHYRAKADRADRAIAGLSMGGFVVMNTGLPHLDTFSELFVYSSGYFPDQIKAFEDNFQAMFNDPGTNDLFRVPFYMSAGETDIALKNGQAVMSIINKYGIRNFWVLSSGGHEWTNWRRDLYQTAQIMFPDCGGK
jgi:enterochelin esterase-like enzyme